MLGSAVMSEIFYRQGIPTERCLAVIGFPDGTAIGVRSAPNLIRPAHIFRYLKQGRHEELKASVDYFIDREIDNGFWQIPAEPKERYAKALEYFARSYAKLAALLEEEYIFNWLSWDGDNMLASGADTRLRLDPTVCRQARQVPLQGCRSLFCFTCGATRLGENAGPGVCSGDGVSFSRVRKKT